MALTDLILSSHGNSHANGIRYLNGHLREPWNLYDCGIIGSFEVLMAIGLSA